MISFLLKFIFNADGTSTNSTTRRISYTGTNSWLGDMHVHFGTQPIYEGGKVDTGNKKNFSDDIYRVIQMKYGKGKDKTILHYNSHITVTGIPLEAYEYVVNGKPALDWVVERQCVKTDKKSGIVNDANDWAVETIHNPRYPLELFLRVITVNFETMKIVKSLPALGSVDKGYNLRFLEIN